LRKNVFFSRAGTHFTSGLKAELT